MMNPPLKLARWIPPLFLVFLLGSFGVMLTFSEPFPAIILPPFNQTSPEGELQTNQFQLTAFGKERSASIPFDELAEGASSIESFFLLLEIPKNQESGKTFELSTSNSLASKIKKIVFSRREKSFQKSNRAYPEMKQWLLGRTQKLTGFAADSLVIAKKVITKKNQEVSSHREQIKSIVFD